MYSAVAQSAALASSGRDAPGGAIMKPDSFNGFGRALGADALDLWEPCHPFSAGEGKCQAGKGDGGENIHPLARAPPPHPSESKVGAKKERGLALVGRSSTLSRKEERSRQSYSSSTTLTSGSKKAGTPKKQLPLSSGKGSRGAKYGPKDTPKGKPVHKRSHSLGGMKSFSSRGTESPTTITDVTASIPLTPVSGLKTETSSVFREGSSSSRSGVGTAESTPGERARSSLMRGPHTGKRATSETVEEPLGRGGMRGATQKQEQLRLEASHQGRVDVATPGLPDGKPSAKRGLFQEASPCAVSPGAVSLSASARSPRVPMNFSHSVSPLNSPDAQSRCWGVQWQLDGDVRPVMVTMPLTSPRTPSGRNWPSFARSALSPLEDTSGEGEEEEEGVRSEGEGEGGEGRRTTKSFSTKTGASAGSRPARASLHKGLSMMERSSAAKGRSGRALQKSLSLKESRVRGPVSSYDPESADPGSRGQRVKSASSPEADDRLSLLRELEKTRARLKRERQRAARLTAEKGELADELKHVKAEKDELAAERGKLEEKLRDADAEVTSLRIRYENALLAMWRRMNAKTFKGDTSDEHCALVEQLQVLVQENEELQEKASTAARSARLAIAAKKEAEAKAVAFEREIRTLKECQEGLQESAQGENHDFSCATKEGTNGAKSALEQDAYQAETQSTGDGVSVDAASGADGER